MLWRPCQMISSLGYDRENRPFLVGEDTTHILEAILLPDPRVGLRRQRCVLVHPHEAALGCDHRVAGHTL